jgi:hypothetical protein
MREGRGPKSNGTARSESGPDVRTLDRRRALQLFGAAAASPLLFGACDGMNLGDDEVGPDAGVPPGTDDPTCHEPEPP